MRLICPSCGAIASVEAWLSNADSRECLRIVAGMPSDVGRKTLPYLTLFRPRVPENDKGYRGLIWPRALRLALDLKRLVEEPFISWENRPARPNNPLAWSQALEQVIQRPPRRLPLETHGYLRRIAYDIADEMDRAVEVKHNRAERDGSLRTSLSEEREPSPGLEPSMSVEEMKAIRRKNMGS
jgi:hypothetical protein